MLTATHWSGGRCYHLNFPVEELAHAIALCGWTLANEIREQPESHEELTRLEALPYLAIPDGREWYAKFATRVEELV